MARPWAEPLRPSARPKKKTKNAKYPPPLPTPDTLLHT